MAATPESFKTFGFSYDEQLARAHWYKDDLEKGGWEVVHKNERSTFWAKSFPEEEIPLKMLFKYKMSLSAEKVTELLSPRNMKYRSKWDNGWLTYQVLEAFPDNGGHVVSSTANFAWPISDREFLLFYAPEKAIEWYGKPAIYTGCVNASHPSRPPNQGGLVRVTNAGNIYIAIADENDPENACTLFGLASNDYAGWIPKFVMELLVPRRLPTKFCILFESFPDAYNNYIAKK